MQIQKLKNYYYATAAYPFSPFVQQSNTPIKKFIMDFSPVDTPLTEADFENCDYQEIINSARTRNYNYISMAFQTAAQNKLLDHNLGESTVLWLFANICGMTLVPNSFNEPFKPYCVIFGKRSMLPDDLTPEQLAFIESIYPKVSDNLLRARMAEIVYLKNRKAYKAALEAVKAYTGEDLSSEQDIGVNALELWERAIFLSARFLKSKAETELNEIEAKLVTTLFDNEFKESRRCFKLKIVNILFKYNLAENKKAYVAKLLEKWGVNFEQQGGFQTAADYYDASYRWYHRAKDEENANRLLALRAEVTEKYAYSRKEHGKHNIASRYFLERAIQKYRKMPSSYRYKHNYNYKLTELQVELDKANRETTEAMFLFQAPPIDIAEICKETEALIAGKRCYEALSSFSELLPTENFSSLRKQAEEMITKSWLAQTTQSVITDAASGRVIAKDLSKNNINSRIGESYRVGINIKAQAYILPALSILRIEHRMREQDFYELTRYNPLIPPDRVQLAAKVLYLGYEGDWCAMLYMLAPLIEHIVRFHLKLRGVPTTHLDERGIEQEKGLSSLIEEEKCKEIFGIDLTEEIRLLFCDSMGSNLRNNVAHGLFDDANSSNTAAVYAWYLLFKLVFLNFWVAKNKKE